MLISSDQFSYAEIPHSFDIITGVTGTLKTLTEKQVDIIKD